MAAPVSCCPARPAPLILQVQRTAPCPGTNDFYLSTLDSNLVSCCSTHLTLPKAKCVGIALPYDGTAVLTATPVLLRAIAIGPCGFIWVKFYDGTTYLGDGVRQHKRRIRPHCEQLCLGIHQISSVAQLADSTGGAGEVETSAPVTLNVLFPNIPPPDQGPPTVLRAWYCIAYSCSEPVVPANKGGVAASKRGHEMPFRVGLEELHRIMLEADQLEVSNSVATDYALSRSWCLG